MKYYLDELNIILTNLFLKLKNQVFKKNKHI